MYKNILIAIDGSATSDRGLSEGLRLAKATGGKVILVHIASPLLVYSESASTAYYQALSESFRKQGQEFLAKAAEAAREAGVPFEQKMIEKVSAIVSDEIVAAAREANADLIVIGTHGRRGLKRVLMGSDAEMVLRQAPVPVLMVREPDDRQSQS